MPLMSTGMAYKHTYACALAICRAHSTTMSSFYPSLRMIRDNALTRAVLSQTIRLITSLLRHCYVVSPVFHSTCSRASRASISLDCDLVLHRCTAMGVMFCNRVIECGWSISPTYTIRRCQWTTRKTIDPAPASVAMERRTTIVIPEKSFFYPLAPVTLSTLKSILVTVIVTVVISILVVVLRARVRVRFIITALVALAGTANVRTWPAIFIDLTHGHWRTVDQDCLSVSSTQGPPRPFRCWPVPWATPHLFEVWSAGVAALVADSGGSDM